MKQLFTLLLAVLLHLYVTAQQPGTLDKTFGEEGVVIGQNFTGDCKDILMLKDGKIISIGNGTYSNSTTGILLVRYNANGTPDMSFGDSGRIVTKISERGSNAFYGAIQTDGKIIIIGSVSFPRIDLNSPFIVRYNNNGAIDSSFGTNGLIIQSFNRNQTPSGLILQPDNKIVVAGSTLYEGDDDTYQTIYLVRYNQDGSHDVSFGNKGIYQDKFGEPADLTGLSLQEDGKFVIGGEYWATDNYPIFLKRYTKNGAPDITFGNDGEAKYYFDHATWGAELNAIALQSDRRIICAATTYDPYLGNAALVRFNENGSIDKTFGNNGAAITTSGDDKLGLKTCDVVITSNGKIIAGTTRYDDYPFLYRSFTAIAYNIDGTIDSTFGNNGMVVTDLDGKTSTTAIALQPDGKFLLGGNLYNPNEIIRNRIALARYDGYDPNKQPLIVRIKRWLKRRGITWQGVQEGNNIRYYSVQKSTDGVAYKEIARAGKKSGMNNYEDAAGTGDAYYRIAAVGWDGSRTYSNSIRINDNQEARIFPNPVRSNLQVQNLPQSGTTNLSVVDWNGNVRSTATAAGSNYSINTANLAAGTYLLKVEHGGTVTTLPFVKE